MFYIIYKTINQINGKYYIGKHQTKNLNDGYQGSGKILRRAFKKYGIENFVTEILEVLDTEYQMNLAERILVVCDITNYNLCPGGQGGFGYINKNKLNNSVNQCALGGPKTVEGKKKRADICRLNRIKSLKNKTGIHHPNFKHNTMLGKKHSEESKLKISEGMKGNIPWNKGIPRSEETKQKLRNFYAKKKMESEMVRDHERLESVS